MISKYSLPVLTHRYNPNDDGVFLLGVAALEVSLLPGVEIFNLFINK